MRHSDIKKKEISCDQASSTQLLFYFSIREPYFISSVQHIEDILIAGWSADSKITCTTNKKKYLSAVTKHCFSLISRVVRVKMGQGEARSISRQDPLRFEQVGVKVAAEIEAWRRFKKRESLAAAGFQRAGSLQQKVFRTLNVYTLYLMFPLCVWFNRCGRKLSWELNNGDQCPRSGVMPFNAPLKLLFCRRNEPSAAASLMLDQLLNFHQPNWVKADSRLARHIDCAHQWSG